MRSGVIIREGDRVALIERVREGRTYYVLPGGRVEPGETAEAAAVREAFEELGVTIALGELAATVFVGQREQRYFLATITGGVFGNGNGPEFGDPAYAGRGTYRAVWLSLAELAQADVRPPHVARALLAGTLVPGQPLVFHEP